MGQALDWNSSLRELITNWEKGAREDWKFLPIILLPSSPCLLLLPSISKSSPAKDRCAGCGQLLPLPPPIPSHSSFLLPSFLSSESPPILPPTWPPAKATWAADHGVSSVKSALPAHMRWDLSKRKLFYMQLNLHGYYWPASQLGEPSSFWKALHSRASQHANTSLNNVECNEKDIEIWWWIKIKRYQQYDG